MKKQLKQAIMQACLSKLSDKATVEIPITRPFEGFFYVRKDLVDITDEIEKVTFNYVLSHLSSPAKWENIETFTMMPEWGTSPLQRSWILRLPTHLENKDRYLFHYFYQTILEDGSEKVSDTFTQMIVPREIEYIDHSGDCNHVILHWSLNNWAYPQNTELEVEGITWGSDYSASQASYRGGIPIYEQGRIMEIDRIPVPRIFKCIIWAPKGEAIDYCFKLIKTGEATIEWDNNSESDYRLIV